MGKTFAAVAAELAPASSAAIQIPAARCRSSRSVNFRFFAKRCAQFNERNARVAKLRAAVHALNHHLDFVNRFCVIPHADQIWSLEYLVGNGFSERLLVIQRDLERCNAIIFQPRVPCCRNRNIRAESKCHKAEADVSRLT